MSFSIEAIRNLNKVHLLALNIPQKENRLAGKQAWQPAPGMPWRVSLYGGATIGVGGTIEYTNTLQGIVKAITNNRVAQLAMDVGQKGIGIAPNIDIPRKYLYSGVNNLAFDVRGVLVLENDIDEDFFVPIEKLAYLAFPDRGVALKFGDTIKNLSDQFSEWLKNKQGIDYSFTDSIGAAYNAIASLIGVPATQDGFTKITEWITNIVGEGYSMTVPPTFAYGTAGSGLDFRYGGILVSDVFIKSLKFDIPKLYYQGGYPAVINVSMSLETMRPLTATALTKIIMTQAQNFETTAATGANSSSPNSSTPL